MIKNRKNVFLIIVLSVILMNLLSCTHHGELGKIAIITAIGLDKEGDDIVVTFEVANTVHNAGSDATKFEPLNVDFVQGKGRTMAEAIRNMYLHFDRELFGSHAQTLIIGEEFAKGGIVENLDYLLRTQEPRENIKIVVAKESKAYEIMGVRGDLDTSSGQYISELLDKVYLSGKSIDINLTEYYKYYYDINNEPVIGVVAREKREALDGEKKEYGNNREMLTVGGGAVTRTGSLIGYFTPDEMLGFHFIVDDVQGGIIVFPTPIDLTNGMDTIGKESDYTSVEILKSKTKKDIQIIDGKIHLVFNIKFRGFIIEENKAVDFENKENIKILEEYCAKEVKKIISKTLDKGQKEFKQDNFSIGETIHQYRPNVWKEINKDWEDIFPEITYSLNVEPKIVKIGMIGRPSNLRRR